MTQNFELSMDMAVDLNGSLLDNDTHTSITSAGLQYSIIENVGPAGGWPLVLVYGPQDKLLHWSRTQYDANGDRWETDAHCLSDMKPHD